MSHEFLIFKNYIALIINIALTLHLLKTVQTTLECCKKNNVPVGCLGLCSIVKPMKMINTPERYTDCSEYKYVIDACFQPGEPRIKGYLLFSIF